MTDQRNPSERFADSFTEEARQAPVPADSEVSRVMAEARESWAQNGVPDPDDFKVTPIPVDLD